MSIEEMAAILGWCTVVNFSLLLLTMIVLFFKNPVQAMHAKMTGLSTDDLNRLYVQYIGRFKTLWIVFNLTPYLVIRIFILAPVAS